MNKKIQKLENRIRFQGFQSAAEMRRVLRALAAIRRRQLKLEKAKADFEAVAKNFHLPQFEKKGK